MILAQQVFLRKSWTESNKTLTPNPNPNPPLHFLSTPCIPWQTLATKGMASVTLCTSRNAPPRAMCDMKRNGCTWMVSTLKLVMRKMNCSRKKRIKKHTCKPKRNETKNILTIKRGKEKTHLEFSHQSALRIGNWAYARAPNSYTLKYPHPPPPRNRYGLLWI